ncbi:MAG: YncE family protein [Candidatus Marinimicrobia bacterium]|nr:YncE family protein [Candidatus Neomarinimicrobiota bacterium]MCF7827338.1 YncE family protein [Candidatus Neomarinimicrobiota bacterium]MCF7881429.1 YncE family protein [Candidatus Neomarinimicrobiota bacterium]
MNKPKVLLVVFGIALLLMTGCDDNLVDSGGTAVEGLFVLNGLAQTVSHIDLTTDEVSLQFVAAREIPSDLGIIGEHLLVLNSSPASMDVFAAEDGNSITTINLPGGSNPYGLHIDGNYIYITGLSSNQLYIVNAGNYTLEDSAAVGTGPQGITSDDSHIFVANNGGWPDYSESSVTVLNKSDYSVDTTISTSTNPQEFTWTPDGNLHVVCTGNYDDITGKVDVIDVNSMAVTQTIEFGGTPGRIASAEQKVYLSDAGDQENGFLYSYDAITYTVLNDNESPIHVNNGAMGLVFSDANKDLYVSNFNANTVQKFDVETGEVLQTYEVSDGPQSLVAW